MLYKELKTVGKRGKNDFNFTHAWVCSLCPAVLFEYWVKANTETLSKYLEKK